MARKDDLRKAAGSWLGAGEHQAEADQAPPPAPGPPAERSGAGATPKAPDGPLIRSTDKTRTSSGRLLRRTIYATPEEWAAVLAAADAESRATGRYVSASDLVRRALRQALGLPEDGGTP